MHGPSSSRSLSSDTGVGTRAILLAGTMRLRGGGDPWWGRSFPWENVQPSNAHSIPDYYAVLGVKEDSPFNEASLPSAQIA